MGKPIAGIGDLPYNIGGFCVSAANVKGSTYTNLNILQQRSSKIFDLISSSGEIYQFVSLTITDKNNQLLDPSLDVDALLPELAVDTFIIKKDDAFITAFQYNKIKLSDGTFIYKPWDLYFCNITPPAASAYLDVEPSVLSMAIHDVFESVVHIQPSSYSKSLVWHSDDDSIAKVDANGVITGVSDGDTVIHAESTIDSNLKDSIPVRVNYIPVTDVKIKNLGYTFHINAGKSISYELELVPANASNRDIRITQKGDEEIFQSSISGNRITFTAPTSSSGISYDIGLILSVGSEERNDLINRECGVLIYIMDEEF